MQHAVPSYRSGPGTRRGRHADGERKGEEAAECLTVWLSVRIHASMILQLHDCAYCLWKAYNLCHGVVAWCIHGFIYVFFKRRNARRGRAQPGNIFFSYVFASVLPCSRELPLFSRLALCFTVKYVTTVCWIYQRLSDLGSTRPAANGSSRKTCHIIPCSLSASMACEFNSGYDLVSLHNPSLRITFFKKTSDIVS